MAPLIRLSLILAVVLLSAPALAGVVHDPWLARLQVGQMRTPVAHAVDESGWPGGLLAPLGVDPGFVLGATRYFAADDLPRAPEQVGWRLALPLLGGTEAANAVYGTARAQASQLIALSAEDAGPLADGLPATGPWCVEIHQLQASRQWQHGQWAEAAATCEALLRLPAARPLDASVKLAWTLRREALRSRLDLAPDLEAIWALLPDLGPYDQRSGWALWLALRRARGVPDLDPEHATRDAGVLIAGAGELFMEAEQFWGLGLPTEAAAGVGALLLPAGRLVEHFVRYPDLPTDGRFQGYWLRGKRRQDPSAANLERLAGLTGVKDGHRLDLWRRASESHLLRTQWEPGLAALEQGLRLMDSSASAGMRARLREWTVQSLALALAEERVGHARRVVSLAEAHLDPSDLQAFREDAAALLARLGDPQPPAGDQLRDLGEAVVRQGQAPVIGSRPRLVLPDPAAWRDRLWTTWASWGLGLVDEADSLLGAQAEYRDGLRFVLGHDDPAQRHTSATALAAGHLGGASVTEPLLDFAWHRDIELMSAGRALPRPTPVPDLLEPAPWADLDRQLRGHALLGVAIALGDDRGMIAAAVRLPNRGLDDRQVRLFWYPVPADAVLRDALASTDLPPELLLAIARNESLFEPAVRSRAGALGYMQIMPFHYQDPAGAPGDAHWSHPATSLGAGARILGSEARLFGGDPYRSVAAYNAGRGAVNRWQDQLRQAPEGDLFWAWIGYPETRHYALRVLRDREVYRWLLDAAP